MFYTGTDPLTGQPISNYAGTDANGARQAQEYQSHVEYLKNLIYNLDRQVKDQERWKNDAQRLEDLNIQRNRELSDLEAECTNKNDTINADKQYIQNLERQIQDANLTIDQGKSDIRNQDDYLTSKDRQIEDLKRTIDDL